MDNFRSILDSVFRHAQQHPESVAFDLPGGASRSYADLASLVRRIAARLVADGVGVGFPLPGVELRITDSATGAMVANGESGIIEVLAERLRRLLADAGEDRRRVPSRRLLHHRRRRPARRRRLPVHRAG